MRSMETKQVCPNCGHQLHRHPYLMEAHPDAEWPWWGKWGIYLLAVLILAAAIHTFHP